MPDSGGLKNPVMLDILLLRKDLDTAIARLETRKSPRLS